MGGVLIRDCQPCCGGSPLLLREVTCNSLTSLPRTLQAVIKNADMSEDMQQDAIDCASQAMEKFNIERDLASCECSSLWQLMNAMSGPALSISSHIARLAQTPLLFL